MKPAPRVDIRVTGGLQRWLDHRTGVLGFGFQTADLFHKVRRFNTCRPDPLIGLNVLAVFGVQAAIALVTIVWVSTRTPILVETAVRRTEIRGGSAGGLRSPASTSVTFSASLLKPL